MPKISNSQILDLLEVARFAPSSHNTQPWKAVITNGELIIGYDPSRQLLVGDPEKNELFISLGCFVESIMLASQDIGFAAELSFLTSKPEKVCRISFKPNGAPKEKWNQLITSRRSDKRLYKKLPLSSKLEKEIGALKYGSAHISLFSDQDAIDIIAAKTYDATLETMQSHEFRHELSGWVRHNWTKQLDGMPAYTQGMPGPISLIAPVVIRKNKAVAKDQAKKDSKRIIHSSAIALICSNDSSPKGLIDIGRLYQKLCLQALKNDVKTTAISAAVINNTTRDNLVKKLKLADQPYALLRLGYVPNNVRKTPRLSLSHIVE